MDKSIKDAYDTYYNNLIATNKNLTKNSEYIPSDISVPYDDELDYIKEDGPGESFDSKWSRVKQNLDEKQKNFDETLYTFLRHAAGPVTTGLDLIQKNVLGADSNYDIYNQGLDRKHPYAAKFGDFGLDAATIALTDGALGSVPLVADTLTLAKESLIAAGKLESGSSYAKAAAKFLSTTASDILPSLPSVAIGSGIAQVYRDATDQKFDALSMESLQSEYKRSMDYGVENAKYGAEFGTGLSVGLGLSKSLGVTQKASDLAKRIFSTSELEPTPEDKIAITKGAIKTLFDFSSKDFEEGKTLKETAEKILTSAGVKPDPSQIDYLTSILQKNKFSEREIKRNTDVQAAIKSLMGADFAVNFGKLDTNAARDIHKSNLDEFHKAIDEVYGNSGELSNITPEKDKSLSRSINLIHRFSTDEEFREKVLSGEVDIKSDNVALENAIRVSDYIKNTTGNNVLASDIIAGKHAEARNILAKSLQDRYNDINESNIEANKILSTIQNLHKNQIDNKFEETSFLGQVETSLSPGLVNTYKNTVEERIMEYLKTVEDDSTIKLNATQNGIVADSETLKNYSQAGFSNEEREAAAIDKAKASDIPQASSYKSFLNSAKNIVKNVAIYKKFNSPSEFYDVVDKALTELDNLHGQLKFAAEFKKEPLAPEINEIYSNIKTPLRNYLTNSKIWGNLAEARQTAKELTNNTIEAVNEVNKLMRQKKYKGKSIKDGKFVKNPDGYFSNQQMSNMQTFGSMYGTKTTKDVPDYMKLYGERVSTKLTKSIELATQLKYTQHDHEATKIISDAIATKDRLNNAIATSNNIAKDIKTLNQMRSNIFWSGFDSINTINSAAMIKAIQNSSLTHGLPHPSTEMARAVGDIFSQNSQGVTIAALRTAQWLTLQKAPYAYKVIKSELMGINAQTLSQSDAALFNARYAKKIEEYKNNVENATKKIIRSKK